MKFIALGGAREVGGSSSLLNINGKNILVDCGIRMNQDEREDTIPNINLIDKLDLILLTHAHMDHSGALPVIHSRFPDVPIYCTGPTHRLVELLLADAVRIMAMENMKKEGETPLYNQELVEKTLDKIHIAQFSEWLTPSGFEGIRIYFHPAGHILGASSIFLDTPEGMIMFSGDISVTNQITVQGIPTCPFRPDVIVMESTYGDRTHIKKRKEEERNLAQSVGDVITGKGSVLIPAFAVGRSQEVILILKNYQKNNLIPRFPIYIDGMVRSVCDIYESMSFLLAPQLQRYVKNSRRPLFFDTEEGIFKVTGKKMRDVIPGEKPCCIISSSGMLTGGPSPLYAKKLIQKEENAILLTGYQDEESPGRKLLNLNQGELIEIEGEKITARCRVAQYNLSAHADSNQINQIISYLNPRSVILVHGNSSSVDSLAGQLRKYNVWRPANNEEINPFSMAPLFVYDNKQSSPHIIPAVPPPVEVIQNIQKPLGDKDKIFSIEDIDYLWRELQKFPLREYSIPELVRLWYGEDFSREQRKDLEQILFSDNLYFEKIRVAKKWVYRPRSPEELKRQREERIEMKYLQPGAIIILRDDEQKLMPAIFVNLDESDEYFSAIIKGKKGIKRCMRKYFVQYAGDNVSIGQESESYWKIYLRTVEKESYQYHKIISAAEAWKILYKVPQPYSFDDIIKMFFGAAPSLEQKMAAAVKLNGNDIFFHRNSNGDYIPVVIEEVAKRLNKTVERLEHEMELNFLPQGTVIIVKPFDDLSKESDEFVIFTGHTGAKGFDCITLQGRKTFWFSKYIDRTEYFISLDGKEEEVILKEFMELVTRTNGEYTE
jgi:Cft2 family RNA processing exonuclease